MRCDYCNKTAVGRIVKGISKGTKYCEQHEEDVKEFLAETYLEDFK